MITRFEAVAAQFPDLEAAELRLWIERRWVQPEQTEGEGWVFHDIDMARLRLVYDLSRDFDASEETMPLVLSLLDQVYELRCSLKTVLQAIEKQPPEVRQALLKAAQGGRGDAP